MDMKLRKLIRNLISENIMLNNNDQFDQFFNYYTTKKEQEETNFSFIKVPARKFGDKVIDELIHIIMNEEGVSEKSFSMVDEVVERSQNLVLTNKEYISIIAEDHNTKCRPQLTAEKIFHLYKASK